MGLRIARHTVNAVRRSSEWRLVVYQRTLARGKKSNQVLIAVAIK
jgi:hypothetical protein